MRNKGTLGRSTGPWSPPGGGPWCFREETVLLEKTQHTLRPHHFSPLSLSKFPLVSVHPHRPTCGPPPTRGALHERHRSRGPEPRPLSAILGAPWGILGRERHLWETQHPPGLTTSPLCCLNVLLSFFPPAQAHLWPSHYPWGPSGRNTGTLG